MKKISDGYYQDLALATLFRIWITLGILSIIAVVSIGCSRSNEVGLPPFGGSAVHDPLDRGEAAQTRNRVPQGGCDEKSDSSLTGPNRRLD